MLSVRVPRAEEPAAAETQVPAVGEGGGVAVGMGNALYPWLDSAVDPAWYVPSGRQRTLNSQGDTTAGRMVLGGCLSVTRTQSHAVLQTLVSTLTSASSTRTAFSQKRLPTRHRQLLL